MKNLILFSLFGILLAYVIEVGVFTMSMNNQKGEDMYKFSELSTLEKILLFFTDSGNLYLSWKTHRAEKNSSNKA